MDHETRIIIEKLQDCIAGLELKIVDLERKIQKVEDDGCYYIDTHGDEHHELRKMIYASYLRTHPEFCEDMAQLHAIVNRKKSRPEEPRS